MKYLLTYIALAVLLICNLIATIPFLLALIVFTVLNLES